MPRPEQRTVTFTIDGLEVTAPENSMLVDAAKHGDVEIPVFCYEPKLGAPVGACRMCLVEIEGIPKLQTGCSTPVKDGMVVHTQTERVHAAQRAVVEFLLINHPLDCPVCDKGGECPLQDITYGWGPGTSRFIEPKRHFRKPLELSPLIAIDRERCILCYRCVRFSQEISEDYQLILRERGAHSYVGTFDETPYVGPFSGNIIELLPASWEKALDAAASALKKAGGKAAALAGGETSNEEAFLLQRLLRDGLGSGNLATRPGGEAGLDVSRALADPALQATVPDLEWAHAVLVLACDPIDDAPILDLRLRKGVRRNGVRLAVASARPGALDPNAELTFRYAPGGGEALLVALDAALTGDPGNLGGAASAAGSNAAVVRGRADFLKGAGEDVVIVYGERPLSRPPAARAPLHVVARLGLRGRPGAGLLEIPSAANGRGVREAGFAPGHGPGFATLAEPGLDALGIAGALAGGDLSVLYLLHADPLRSFPDR